MARVVALSGEVTVGRVKPILAVWLIVAVVVGATGMLARSPVPPPAIAVVLTALGLAAVRFSSGLRTEVRQLGPAPLVAFHIVRILAGAYFLHLFRQGVLPAEFALGAGWGDIIIGLGAIAVLVFALPLRTAARQRAFLAWNTLGLIDILLVLGNGARLFLGDPTIAAPFTRLPLAVLPLFVVPIVIVSHVLLYQRHFRARHQG